MPQAAFISFVRHVIVWPVICKELSGGLSPLYFYFFMNAGKYIAGGLTSLLKGQHFPLNYVSLRQSLCFWSVITVIYSCGFLLKGFPLYLSQSGISGTLQLPFGVCPPLWLLTTDTGLFYFTWSRKFSVSIKLMNEHFMFSTLRDWGWCLSPPYNCKPHIFHNIFKSQK